MEQVQALDADEEVKEKITKEISRFKSVGNNSAESGVIPVSYTHLVLWKWENSISS